MTSQATFNSISGRSADRGRVLLWTFFSSFFELFQMAIPEKNGQVPHSIRRNSKFSIYNITVIKPLEIGLWMILNGSVTFRRTKKESVVNVT